MPNNKNTLFNNKNTNHDNKITEFDVRQWIRKSYILFYTFDRPNLYVNRYKKIGCYERFFVNFNTKSGKLLVYTSNERKLKKKILFATKSKVEMLNKDLAEIYYKVCPTKNIEIKNI